jgi:hypothetical protein
MGKRKQENLHNSQKDKFFFFSFYFIKNGDRHSDKLNVKWKVKSVKWYNNENF